MSLSSSSCGTYGSAYLLSAQKERATTYSASACLREAEVRNNTLSSTPYDEDDICLPSNLLQRNRPGIGVDEASGIDKKRLKCHALGADLEGQILDWVQRLQRSNVERVDDAEDKDERQDSVRGGVVVVDGITVLGAARDEVAVEAAGRGGHTHPDDACSCSRISVPAPESTLTARTEEASKHKLAATELLDEERAYSGSCELNAIVAQADIGLANLSVDTNGIEDSCHEVGKRTIYSIHQ
jgi:hypothetical protein